MLGIRVRRAFENPEWDQHKTWDESDEMLKLGCA